MSGFLAELKRRNVIRMAGLYLVGAWLLVQVAGAVLPMFGAPVWLPRSVVLLLAIGFIPALVFSWAFELTPQGLKRDEDVPPEQSIAPQTGRRMDRIIIFVLVLALGYFVVDKFVLAPRRAAAPTVGRTINKKSIAVLPFENRSRDPDNAYFADGIQDEILTRLSKIADLKVISRKSTQHYKSAPENLSEIASQLGVANIVEGSVQKAADHVHINVQLIRAATDEHLWAESYDRKLENIFAVEGEVATSVADALKAKLSGAEQSALNQKSTNNPGAYDAYLRGLAFSLRPGYYESDTLNAIKYFGKAVELDPKFALAWAWLAHENALAFYFNIAGSDVRALREAARDALSKAIELQPNLGEAYLAEGYFYYYCERDNDSAIASLEKARQLSPRNNQILEALALVWRRKNDWERSLEYFQQAKELDPRDVQLLSSQAETHFRLRQYPAALKLYDQVLEISPGNAVALANKVGIYQAEGNLPAAATLLSQIRLEPDSEDFSLQVDEWTYERRYVDAIAVLKKAIERRDRPLRDWQKTDYSSALALLQQLSGDATGARVTWQGVQTEVEELRRTKEQDFGVWALASAYAALGDKSKAFAILEHAEAIERPFGDLLQAAAFVQHRARIAAMTGDKDLALEQLAISAQQPGGATYGDLKLHPLWDPLRSDPRFEKIVAGLAPK